MKIMVQTFLSSFWDQEFNGTTGYDALISRLKDGKKLCDAYGDFLKNRAKLEEDYGKNMIRLAQSAGSNEEIGTLKNSWDSVKKETEYIGNVHCELSVKLNDLSSEVMKFREKQKNDRVKVDEKMKHLQKDKKTAYDNLFKAKKTYEQRCRESDNAKETYESKGTYTPKEEEKFKKILLKAKTSAESADSAYQSAVKALEDHRKKWTLEMEDSLKAFQKWEEERIVFLRNQMWSYTNTGSKCLLYIDERYESMRKVLESCDENADLDFFIARKGTGSDRPSPIKYENYYHINTVKPNSYETVNTNIPTTRGSDKKASTLPRKASHEVDEGGYASVNDFRSDNMRSDNIRNNRRVFMRAAFEYTAQGAEELSLKPGDIVEVLGFEDSDWGIGLLNGKKGAFPRDFVEAIMN